MIDGGFDCIAGPIASLLIENTFDKKLELI
jgi:hypothetical protein